MSPPIYSRFVPSLTSRRDERRAVARPVMLTLTTHQEKAMRTCPRLRLLLLLVPICMFPLTAFAQQETATMTGTVRDPSGAVVQKATVIVTNIRTNISVTTETDDAGFYTIPSLLAG